MKRQTSEHLAKNRLSLLVIILCFISLPAFAQQPKFQASWQSLEKYEIPAWFRDAKFGIFIHWGVYSVPAFNNEWYPREMYLKDSKVYKHHIETYGTQDKFGYKDFIPMFKAEKFNAEKWVELFKKSGAKYIVPVAEHHDGFAMYNSALTRWNAFLMGPKRDVVGELEAASRKAGLMFGVSSHRIEHWWFFGGGRNFDSDVNDSAFADFYGPATNTDGTKENGDRAQISPEFMNDWLLRDVELVNKYHPDLVWFDWWIAQKEMEPYRKSFAAFYYNKAKEWNKEVVINYKHDAYPDSAAVLDLERGKLSGIRALAWQTDDAIGNKSWGFTNDNDFKSTQYVITNLIDIVSKNGNLLLNIGPRSDGTITDEETNVLLGTGKWLAINGEAIYGTRPWKLYGEGPTESASGEFKMQKPYTSKDIRFTTHNDTLYAITLALPAPKENININALSTQNSNGTVADVQLIGSDEKLKWSQKKNMLTINAPKSYPADDAAAFRIIFKK
ncbi:MAG: alpha-L-fucosidase [Ginsengibacter sp.]